MLCKLHSAYNTLRVYTVWYYTEGFKSLYSRRPIFRVLSGKKLHRAENFYTDAVCGVCDKYRVWLAGLRESLQPCSQAARKWRENEEMKRKWRENEEIERKWRENEEMEREWGNGEKMRKLRGNGERMRKEAENEEIEREWGNGQRMRKWTENEEIDREWGNGKRMRKSTENEEMERKWGNGKRMLAASIYGLSRECRENLNIRCVRK